MLTDRILGAFMFRSTVYAEVEDDASFTQSAWLIVAVTALLSALGTNAAYGFGNIVGWLVATLVTAVFMVAGFALAAFLVAFVGKSLFQAEIDFEQAVRVMGLAYVWNVVGFIGVVGAITPLLACVLAPISFVAAIAGLAAWLIAIKEALDLDWGRSIVVVLVAWLASVIVTGIATTILALMGFTAGSMLSMFSGS